MARFRESFNQEDPKMTQGRNYAVLTIAVVVVFFFASLALFGWWYTIDQGERGVILRTGAIIGTAEPGFHIKTPWIDEVEKISVQAHVWYDEQLEAYSRDQQPAIMRLSVNYRVNPAEVENLYTEYGSIDNLIQRRLAPRVLQATKTVFGSFQAATAISERARLNTETTEAITTALKDTPEIIIDSSQIEDISFSDAYEASIEQRMLAEVEVQKIRQNAERELVNAEIAVTQAGAARDSNKAKADGDAYVVRERAKADADAIRARVLAEAEAIEAKGEAEAVAINARGRALRDNPLLIELTRAERWDGALPTTMLPNGTVPFLTTQP